MAQNGHCPGAEDTGGLIWTPEATKTCLGQQSCVPRFQTHLELSLPAPRHL